MIKIGGPFKSLSPPAFPQKKKKPRQSLLKREIKLCFVIIIKNKSIFNYSNITYFPCNQGTFGEFCNKLMI